jgi:4-hydroxy-2-oxoheptanedioate aldolase
MIPMMIKGGYAALAVAFDVWGLANLVHDGLVTAKGYLPTKEQEDSVAVENGAKGTNGTKSAEDANGTQVVVNGH